MKDFYVYLPSNIDFLHENKASRYVTKLANKLTLSNDWECCLKEIHYPRSWNTLDHDEGKFGLVRAINITPGAHTPYRILSRSSKIWEISHEPE